MKFSAFMLASLALATSIVSCKKKDDPAPVGNARIQFVNAAPGQNLDIYENNARTHDNLAYKANTIYKPVQATGRSVQVTANGTIDPKLVTLTLNPPNNSTQTIFLNKQAAGTTTLNALVMNDTITGATAGKAMVRFINLALVSGNNVQVTRGNELISGMNRAYGYRQFTRYVALDPGNFNLKVRNEASGDSLLGKSIPLTAGKFYTVVAVGEPATAGGGTSTLDLLTITND